MPGAAARSSQRWPSAQSEPAQQPGQADVGGDDAQVVAGGRELHIVDPDDFSAVDVDDLLVEQLFVEQQLIGHRGRSGSRRSAPP